MKKILFLLVGIAIAITASAQRVLLVNAPEQLPCSVLTSCVDTACVIKSAEFFELSSDYTEVRLILDNDTRLVYAIPMRFDSVLDLHLNQKWVMWKHGYISRKQFCEYKHKYNRIRSDC